MQLYSIIFPRYSPHIPMFLIFCHVVLMSFGMPQWPTSSPVKHSPQAPRLWGAGGIDTIAERNLCDFGRPGNSLEIDGTSGLKNIQQNPWGNEWIVHAIPKSSDCGSIFSETELVFGSKIGTGNSLLFFCSINYLQMVGFPSIDLLEGTHMWETKAKWVNLSGFHQIPTRIVVNLWFNVLFWKPP